MHNSESQCRGSKLKLFHIDGAGQRPDGTGSGYAWVRIRTGQEYLKRIDGLTNNVAEYRGLLAVLRHVTEGSHVEICTDSMLVAQQFSGNWAVNDPKLVRLLSAARELIADKDLTVQVTWISREENAAGKVLERRKVERQ
jgi:ribonuclease HI